MSDRYDLPELEELVGDGPVTPDVRRADELLRAVPAPPPELPRSLQTPVLPPPEPARRWTRRRTFAVVALAAAVAALFFGLGTRTGGDGFDAVRTYSMTATENARGAAATLEVGETNADGNRSVRLVASGLPKLPDGGYYVLWLEKDGEYAGTCGTFAGGEAQWTVSYDLWDYDAWIVSARLPGRSADEAKQVLTATIGSA